MKSKKSGVKEISSSKVTLINNLKSDVTSRDVNIKMAGKKETIYYDEDKDPAPYKVNLKQKPKKNDDFVSIDHLYVAKCLSDGNYSDYVDMKPAARDTVTVMFATIENANRCVVDKKLKEKFEIYIPVTFITVSGVVKGLHESTDYEELMKEIKNNDEKIVSMKRLTYRDKDGKMQPANKLSVTFRSRKLPDFIFCYGLRKKIHPFKCDVKQCKNCGVFGHEEPKCRRKKISCKKCYRIHEESVVCEIRCRNCRGKHLTTDSACPELKNAKNIQNYMSAQNVGFYEAKKLLSQKNKKKAPVKTQKDFPSLPKKNDSENSSKKFEPKVTPAQRATYAESLKRKKCEMEHPKKPSGGSSFQIDCSSIQNEIKQLRPEQWKQIVELLMKQLTEVVKTTLSMNENQMDESLVNPPSSDDEDDDDYKLETNEFFNPKKMKKIEQEKMYD